MGVIDIDLKSYKDFEGEASLLTAETTMDECRALGVKSAGAEADITKREEFRKISVTAPACDKQIYGHGLDGYLEAVDFLLERARSL